MKYSWGLLTTILISCTSPEMADNCPQLKLAISASDKIDRTEDTSFGVGDDDLFAANDVKFHVMSMGRISEEIVTLNDYNLQTAYHREKLPSNKVDTLLAMIDLKGLRKIQQETAVVVNEIQVFNGDRKDLISWKNSVKAKDVEFRYHSMCIGEVTLNNTLVMQSISLGKNSIALFGGGLDTLQIIKSVYPSASITTNYSLSEIKFAGLKNY